MNIDVPFSILSWNVCRNLSDKLKDPDFIDIITAHDLICLYECWIKDEDDVSLSGFIPHVVPRNIGKGGGIVVYLRESFKNVCMFVENVNDSIVIFKLITTNPATYMFINYIPPMNSTYYDVNDVDLFEALEDNISKFRNLGNILAMGDFNSRTGLNHDFIKNDELSDNCTRILSNVINYPSGQILEERRSMDTYLNQFGRRLLDLCKTEGLMIVNGRHKNDPHGSFTFYCHNGASLIDYVLTDKQAYKLLQDFSSGTFYPFSDHSPVTFMLNTTTEANFQNEIYSCEESRAELDDTCMKWNEQNKNLILESVESVSGRLQECCIINEFSQESINLSVDNFSNTLHNTIAPFCTCLKTKATCNTKQTRTINADKPWFSDECKKRYLEYKEALKIYSRFLKKTGKH